MGDLPQEMGNPVKPKRRLKPPFRFGTQSREVIVLCSNARIIAENISLRFKE